jgi:hypothetical protein
MTAAAVAVVMSSASPVWACSVCYGDKDSAMVQGAGAGVLFMLLLTYALLVFGFGGMAALWFVRSRRLRRDDPATSSTAGE